MPAMTEPKLIAGNANRPLATAIARRMSMHRGMNVSLCDARVERFNDQEIFVEIQENVRGQDVFVLSDAAAIAWRSVVFGRSLREVLEDKDIGAELAEFVRLGFVRLRWRGSDTITPAVAMCPPLKPYSPVPLGFAPALSLSGAARGAGVVSLSPLTATRFAESACNSLTPC